MFRVEDLTGFRDAQVAHMMDVCIIQSYAGTLNSFHEPADEWVNALLPSPCGLDMRPGTEHHGSQNTQLQYDATVRLSIGSDVSAKARIKIVSRFGETLEIPLIFDVVGPMQRGPSGIRLLLRRIET